MADRRKSAGKVKTKAPQAPEAAAAERGRFIESIIDLSPDILYIYDLADRRNVYSNRGIETVLGYSPEDIRAMGDQVLPGLMHPDDLKAYAEKTVPRYSGTKDGERIEHQFRMRHRSGDWRWLDCVEAVYRRQPDGSPRQIFGVAHDITASKLAAEALRDSEQQLAESQQVARIGSWQLNLTTGKSVWSDELFRLLGLDPRKDPADFTTLFSMIHPDDRLALKSGVEKTVKTGRHYSMDYRVNLRDGTSRTLHAQAVLKRDETGTQLILSGTTQDNTERTEADRRLRESEEKFRTIFENAIDGIMIADTATRRHIEANPAICSMLGYTREELLGLTVEDLHPKEGLPAILDAFERQLRGETPFTAGIPMLRKDGAVLYADINATPVTLGGKRCLVGIFRDITERKQAEDAIRVRESKLHTLFDSVNDEILILGLDGTFLEVNEFVCRRLGYSKEEFLRMSPHDIDTPEAAGKVRENIGNILREGKHQFESEQVARDGSRVPVEISARVIDYDGQRAILAVCRDITERKKAEDRLRRSEHFVRNILDTVDEGFLVIDRDYRILTANNAYCRQVGLSTEEAIGRHCYEVSHRTRQPCSTVGEECAARRVFDTGAPHTVAHQHRDARGGLVFVETRCFPITDGSGAVTSVIETINNITERHLLEEERLKTQKLESIGTLAGGIAHDFNNLLQGIFGYISMAKLTLDEREQSLAMLEQAEKALHQSISLTNQLLTFSKGGKPVKTRISLLPVIESAARFALSGSRSGFRIESDPGLWQVDADAGQLGQVIQNIVLNADQAMPLGGSVLITARNLPASKNARPRALERRDCVLVSIQDSGVGISEEYLGKIFDPYFTTKERGSGLGLASSYSIVRNHEGAIDVRSVVGKGSTFLVYLPALGAVVEEPREEAAPAGTRAGRILVMDDEALVRNVAGELLAALGHAVAFADKGETALEAYSAARQSDQPFDVVILDLTIRNGMGGEETMRKLLEIDPEVQAVVSSGYSDNAGLAHYRQQGFKAFLKKPYSMRELRKTLEPLLAAGARTSSERSLPS